MPATNFFFATSQSEGGAGIHFLQTHFSSRPARAQYYHCATRSAASCKILAYLLEFFWT